DRPEELTKAGRALLVGERARLLQEIVDMSYPVTFDVERPSSYDRTQLALRFVLMFLMASIGTTLGWLFGVLYLALPAFAAGVVSQRGGPRYLGEVAPQVVRFLRWVMATYSYFGLVTDKPPLSGVEPGVTFDVELGGAPTTKSALLRLLRSIPAAF